MAFAEEKAMPQRVSSQCFDIDKAPGRPYCGLPVREGSIVTRGGREGEEGGKGEEKEKWF